MKQYTFGEVTKTLKANTYYLEEKAKEAAGLTDEMEQLALGLQKQFRTLSAKLKDAKPEEVDALADKMEEVEMRVNELSAKMAWYIDFSKSRSVLDLLLVEGADGITEENIGRRQVLEVWADFFA